MAGGLSKRPLRLKVDDGTNHNIPSFVQKVLSNDDLLMEILLRLSIIPLQLFKHVCKQWLALITSSSFTLTRTRIPNVDPPSGLFIGLWNSNKYDYDFVSFDPRIPAKRSINPLVCLGRWIDQSCNGLLLCYIGCHKYYVCNPSISMFKMLPPIHDLNYERNGDMIIAFDPAKSPCYKVVHVGNVDDDDNDDKIPYSIRIQTYSSETGVWSVSDDQFSYQWIYRFRHGIYWNCTIHWLSFYEPLHVIKLDIANHPVLTKIQTPLPLTVKGHVHLARKLLKSHGSLLLLCKDYDCSRHLNIYEIKNGYSVWSVKYFVSLDDMMKPYPKWRIPTNWHCHDILSIVLGERDEDSFMVVELFGKILQYKFVLETVSELFDLGKADSQIDSFEYIASFAHT